MCSRNQKTEYMLLFAILHYTVYKGQWTVYSTHLGNSWLEMILWTVPAFCSLRMVLDGSALYNRYTHSTLNRYKLFTIEIYTLYNIQNYSVHYTDLYIVHYTDLCRVPYTILHYKPYYWTLETVLVYTTDRTSVHYRTYYCTLQTVLV